MRNETEKLSILRVTGQATSEIEDTVVREISLTISLNNQELVTLLCSPTKLEYLATGFLLSQGLIDSKDDIKKITINDKVSTAYIETQKTVDVPVNCILASSGGRNTTIPNVQKVSVEPQMKLSAPQVFSLMNDFVQLSTVFKSTGGVHSAALCDTKDILIFSEDIGRHNAIDKILGECLLKNISTDNHFIITSGRVSSEILLKIAKRNIPILISKSAPTDQGVKLANDLDVTLVAFVREKRMNIYANNWRIVTDGE